MSKCNNCEKLSWIIKEVLLLYLLEKNKDNMPDSTEILRQLDKEYYNLTYKANKLFGE